MRKRRSLTIGFFVALIVVQAISTLFLFVGQAHAQTITAADQDLRHRQLHTFAQCLTQDIIDEDDDISDFGDLFDNNEDERNVIVVGRDREHTDGVMTCATVIRQGLEAFEPGAGNYERWLIEELTGENFDEDGGDLPHDNINENRQRLYDRIKAMEHSMGSPSDALRQERYFPLVDICYEREDLSGGDPPRTIDRERDFVVDGVGAYYFRDDLDDDSINFLDQDGIGNSVDLGDIELGFLSQAGPPGSFQQWNPWESDFYPIGSDVPRETEGYLQDAIVSCHFVFNNWELIFEGAQLVDGEVVNSAGTPIGATTPDVADAEDQSCETEGAELSWLLCPILFALDKFIGGLDEAIQNMLIIPNSYVENPELRQAWGSLRNIAYIVLVPIMLVMVIGTALGFEFFSAYTVKRALPRLIAATLFIALSWQLMTFLVIMVNNIGVGLGGIIAAPFGGIDNITLASIMSPTDGESAAFTTGAVFGGLLTLPLLLANIPVMLSLAFTTALGLAIGFLLLSFRQLLVMALLLLAPLAILAWIFPGNDKLWKLWWGTFSKLLLLFPLISILIASGRALAQVTSDSEGSIVGTVIKIIAYVGPYFMIPAMFKFAGGLFATVAGITNDKSRGIFDKAKEKRQAKVADNMAKWKTGSLANGGRAGALSNRLGANLGTGMAGMYGLRRGVANQRMDQMKEERALNEVMRSSAWQPISQNDDAQRAATYDTERQARQGLRGALAVTRDRRDANGRIMRNAEGEALQEADEAATTQRVEDAINSYKATGYKFGDRSAQIAAARQLSTTGTGYNDLDDQAEVLARVAHGSYGTASSLAGFVNFENKRAGRSELAPGFAGTRDSVVAAGGIRGAAPLTAGQRQDLELAASQSVDIVSSLRGKTPQVRNNAQNLQGALEDGVHDLAELEDQINGGQLQGQQLQVAQQARVQVQTRIRQVMGQINQYESNRSYAAPANQTVVDELVANTSQTRGRALELLTGETVAYDAATREPTIVHNQGIQPGQAVALGQAGQAVATPMDRGQMSPQARAQLADIDRRSATPQRANNPNMMRDEPAPPAHNNDD
ncbi:MAG TPA: hypothetical protein VK694_01510 [Verrucomicrobiae bacterium]|nr:hypothetical protein [Verrucomicrobiae bacterium]